MKCPVKKVDKIKLQKTLDDAAKKLERTMKSKFGFNKIVYLSHPYGGVKQNAEELITCQRMLSEMHPDWLVIDPVAAFGHLYYSTEYSQGLNMTMFLLSMLADEMIVCSDKYQESKGCMAEIEFCKKYNVPIAYTTADIITANYYTYRLFYKEE